MAAITGILCQVVTGNFSGAGTDGRVYLGLGGREFRLDSTADDFERASIREYVMGRGPVEPISRHRKSASTTQRGTTLASDSRSTR